MRGTNVLLAVIAGLLAANVIVLIRADLGRAPASGRGEIPDTGREPERRVSSPDDTADRIARSVDSLRASVERLNGALEEWKAVAESRSRGGGDAAVVDHIAGEGRPPAMRSKDLAAAIQAAPDPARRKALDDMRADEYEVVNRRHWFMTIEEVLQRYGSPDQIGTDTGGQVQFIYHTELSDFTLSFFDGRLLIVEGGGK